jgi:hypothetical protein
MIFSEMMLEIVYTKLSGPHLMIAKTEITESNILKAI